MHNDEFPLAYFVTWTTYGTWLPGDERGWCKRGSRVVEAPDSALQDAANHAMAEETVILTQAQRDLADAVIVKHCAIREWVLHARNVRSNHVHVVVSAALDGGNSRPIQSMVQPKAIRTSRLVRARRQRTTPVVLGARRRRIDQRRGVPGQRNSLCGRVAMICGRMRRIRHRQCRAIHQDSTFAIPPPGLVHLSLQGRAAQGSELRGMPAPPKTVLTGRGR